MVIITLGGWFVLQHKGETAPASTLTTLSTEQLPAESLTDENPTQSQEVPAREMNSRIAGVDQDLDAIKVSTEFIGEDLHAPEDATNNSYNLEGIDLTDMCDEDNVAVDANSSLQELITNSTLG